MSSPASQRSERNAELTARGGYVLAAAAAETPQPEGIAARLVSMPCAEWFAEQDDSYLQEVLPAGGCVSLEHSGEEADYQTLYNEFGITAGRVATAAAASLARIRAR